MQCTENSGCFSPGESEQPENGATQLFVLSSSSFSLCAVFSCFHTTGCETYSFYDRWM